MKTWLITFQWQKISRAMPHPQVENRVIRQDPLLWLCEHLRDWPQENYVLLSAVQVEDGDHVTRIMDENSGEPYGGALEEE